jgi:hypothetical protein
VLVHATAEARNGSEAGGLGGVVHGTNTAPPPVSQLYLGRTGRLFIVASGVANHAGHGNCRAAGAPNVHGNAPLIGIEHANDNRGEPWPAVMYNASIRLTAALLRHLGSPARNALAHREFSTTGKTDPVGVGMVAYRRDVAALLAAPKPTDDGGDMPTAKEIAEAFWNTVLTSPSVKGGKEGHGVHELLFAAIATAHNSAEMLEALRSIDGKLTELLAAREG